MSVLTSSDVFYLVCLAYPIIQTITIPIQDCTVKSPILHIGYIRAQVYFLTCVVISPDSFSFSFATLFKMSSGLFAVLIY